MKNKPVPLPSYMFQSLASTKHIEDRLREAINPNGADKESKEKLFSDLSTKFGVKK